MALRYSSHNIHVQAKEAEQAGETDAAIKLYLQAIKSNPLDDLAYNRLMVQLRKRKEYKEEIKVIKTAISSHQDEAREQQQQWLKRNKKTARTATALVKSLGMVDRKGLPNVETRQLSAWKKRLALIQKKTKGA